MDECTQSLEASSVVALGRGCRELVLIGDHKQLPPTVTSKCAADHGEMRDLWGEGDEMICGEKEKIKDVV